MKWHYKFEIKFVPTDPLASTARTWGTNQFALIGKEHTAPIGSPMQINSALYSRTAKGGDVNIDVHAIAAAGPASQGVKPILTLGMVGRPSVQVHRWPLTIPMTVVSLGRHVFFTSWLMTVPRLIPV